MTSANPGTSPLTLHADTYGPTDADTVVLLGSLGSTTEMWLPQLDGLSNRRGSSHWTTAGTGGHR
jgi:3-oxoadipate enol-lactonase